MNPTDQRQILFLIFIFIALLLIIGALIFSNSVSAAENGLGLDNQNTTKKLILFEEEDAVMYQDEKIEADVITTNSSLSIAGELYGDVIALKSDVYIEESGTIFGNVVCYFGDVKKDEGARIAGSLISVRTGDKSYVNRTECHDIDNYRFPYHLFTSKTEDIRLIEKDQNMMGDVIIMDQEMTIDGKVDGNVICLSGEIYISETAAIDGHVINFDGKIDISSNALITGEVYDNTSRSTRTKRKGDLTEESEIQKAIEKKYLKNRNRKNSTIVRFLGNVTIEEDEMINGDVVVMKGTTCVLGEVNGDVVTIFGNIEIDSTAYVSGDVVSVGGRIYREQGSFVGGDVVQTSWTGVKVDEGDQHVEVGLSGIRVGPKKGDEWRREKIILWNDDDSETEKFLVRYNRVEGLFLGVNLPRYYWEDASDFHVSLYGHAGYGFKSKRARYQVGLERWFFNNLRFTIGAEAHDVTDTQDKWIISAFENSLAAFLLREDFQDYYRRVGLSGYVMQNITPKFRLTLGYRKDKFYNMEKKTNWSIFGGKKKFRANPFIVDDEMEMKSIFAEIGLDTRNSIKYPTQGWYIKLRGEFAGRDLNDNDIDFDRFVVDVRRYQPLSYGENLDFRFRIGTSRGELPLVFRYDIGGISTLRGYRFKEFENGDRMILGNVEYRIYGSKGILRRLFWLDEINLIFFADAGLVWNAENNNAAHYSFKQLQWDDLKTDIGIAFSNQEGNVRLSFAQRMDDKDKPMVVTFRIRRPF